MSSGRYSLKPSVFFLMLLSVGILYVLLRFGLLGTMNEYVDYDEGTYLLIARLINRSILPYRDIYAVHPPFYYFALAIWIKLFGDSYVVGRLFSAVLGFLSLFLAYYIGRELKNRTFGVLLAILFTMDPLLILMNSRVLHESLVELMVLLSLYYFIRYSRTFDSKYSYISLFWAAIGTTVKFTMIPFLVALFLSLLLLQTEKTSRYAETAASKIISAKQILIIVAMYLVLIAFSASFLLAWPSKLSRILVIVPGIHEITKVGHVYSAVLVIFTWLILVMYIFQISYLSPLRNIVLQIYKRWRVVVIFLLVVILGKALIEIPLGVVISPSYLNYTYLAQGSRGLPFIAAFNIFHGILSAVENSNSELVMPWLTTLLLGGLVLLKSLKCHISREKSLEVLLIFSGFMYLVIFPMLSASRYVLPLLITWYVLGSFYLSQGKHQGFNTWLVAFLILVLALADYGMVSNYSQGKLNIAMSVHAKELRDDLSEYLAKYPIEGKVLSTNPMNTYYLNLQTSPYLLDTFGIVYLYSENPRALLQEARSRNVSYFILSTWMYQIMEKDKKLYKGYSTLLDYVLKNGTLLFGESFNNKEVLEMFFVGNSSRNIVVRSQEGKVEIIFLMSSSLDFRVWPGANFSQTFGSRITRKRNGEYNVSWWDKYRSVNAALEVQNDSVEFHMSYEMSFFVAHSGVVLEKSGRSLLDNHPYKTVRVCTSEGCVEISADNITKFSPTIIRVSGERFSLKYVEETKD